MDLPHDFQECVRFHGHLCPGLAIGYAAVKAGIERLNPRPSPDEEVVAVVENDSCAVDAVQVLLGCTFGKGNLVFRDWGKQVFTFFDRDGRRAVRVSFVGEVPGREQRHLLRQKIDSGLATDEDHEAWERLRFDVTREIITRPWSDFFEVREVHVDPPPKASVVQTVACEICGEAVAEHRLAPRKDKRVCRDCAGER
ncbi:MAG: FmdE family protein [Desulfomonilaceae bacterium]|nr:FmdE family protein [Desulfomonilaceae bacterium]